MQAQQFSTQPAAVKRQKYRDEDEFSPIKNTTNIMHDRRVIRGNTYASMLIPETDPAELDKKRESQRRRLVKANYKAQRASTPEPVPGRHHMDVQTDTYLETLTDRVTEFEAETQTDFLLDRPQSPLFIPAKSGVDCSTQIEKDELFDFDTEVEPILQVLVGKTLERSMMEVLEDAELEAMRRHQEYFQQLREQEMIEVQRMEAAEQRRTEEIDRRVEQEKARNMHDDAVLRKIISRNISRRYLSGLGVRCFDELQDAGIFKDTALNAVEGEFIPDLIGDVQKAIREMGKSEELLNMAIQQALQEKSQQHGVVRAGLDTLIDEYEAAEQAEQDEKNEARRVERMERERVKAEEARMRTGEGGEEWIRTLTVASYEEGVLTLEGDDSEEPWKVPEELVATLTERISTNSEAEEKVPVEVRVNMNQRTVLSLMDPVPAAEATSGE